MVISVTRELLPLIERKRREAAVIISSHRKVRLSLKGRFTSWSSCLRFFHTFLSHGSWRWIKMKRLKICYLLTRPLHFQTTRSSFSPPGLIFVERKLIWRWEKWRITKKWLLKMCYHHLTPRDLSWRSSRLLVSRSYHMLWQVDESSFLSSWWIRQLVT